MNPMRTVPSPLHDARGVSVMETISVIGIMTMILVMVAQMFSSGYNIYFLQGARIDAEVGAVLATRAISEATRGAMEVEASSVINGTTYTSDGDTLVLKLPSVNSSNDIIAGSFDHMAVFIDPSNSKLVKTATQIATNSKRPSGTRLITGSNLTLAFHYNEPTITDSTRVQAYLVNTQTRRTTTVTAKSWTAIFLRNN